MDITIPARRKAVADSALTALVGSDATFGPWIFRIKPGVDLRALGSACIVLDQTSGWTARNTYNTLSFPVLVAAVYVDPDRDASHNPTGPVAVYDECRAICDQLIKTFSSPDGAQTWDTVRVVSSHVAGEPDVTPALEKDGMVRGIVRFNLQL
jgi:hypothetical protein